MKKIVFAGQRLFMKFGDLDYFRRRLEPEGMEVVSGEGLSTDDLANLVADAHAVVVIAQPVTREMIEGMSECEFIMTLSVGYDCVDVAAATEHSIPVSNSPTYCSDDVANHAMTLILAVSRKIHRILPETKKGGWQYAYTKPIFNYTGKRLGIVGLGKIGRALVPKAKGFGLEVSAYDPYVPDDVFDLVGVARRYELSDMLEESDYISIHAPLTGETHHLFDADAFSRMKPESVLVNTARGNIIDQPALVDALNGGRIAGAGIDVLHKEPPDEDEPLLACDNALVTPHIAWYSEESFQKNMSLGMDEVIRVLSGFRPRHLVNPAVFGA